MDTKAETVADLLRGHAIPDAEIEARYGPVNRLLQRMLGTVPHGNRYMEIWPPGFRSQNLIVPNLLNVPLSVFGFAAPMPMVGLSMYAASKAAKCMYCTAHSCTFAMRRGLSAEEVARAIGASDPEGMSATELAVVGVASGMSAMPATLQPEQVRALRAVMKPSHVEWVALAAAMMGFLNKCMDALGVELEQSVVADVGAILEPTGWQAGRHEVRPDWSGTLPMASDSFWGLLGWLPLMPAALRLDTRWMAGVPGGWPEAGRFLQEHTSHDFPLLARVGPARVRKAITTVLRDNLAPSDLGAPIKHLVAVVFARVMHDDPLLATAEALAGGDVEVAHAVGQDPVDLDDVEAVAALRHRLCDTFGVDRRTAAALVLARGASESPVRLPRSLLDTEGRVLQPAELVELISWLGVLQLLHRMQVYYDAAAQLDASGG